MNGQHSGTTVNVDTRGQSVDGRARIRLDRNLPGNKCLGTRLQVGVRDNGHLSVACIEPHDIVRAVRRNSRAEEHWNLAGGNGAYGGESIYNPPSIHRKGL